MNMHFRVAGRHALKLEELGVMFQLFCTRPASGPICFGQTRVLVTTAMTGR